MAKSKFARVLGMEVAGELCAKLKGVTERLIVAGSLRRRKETVSDVEIMYIPKFDRRQSPVDMFSTVDVNLADELILSLVQEDLLEYRLNTKGGRTYGPKNKLLVHRRLMMPVDLFSATPENWWNYLVCRTGPAPSNIRIASMAKARGWHWDEYEGFVQLLDGKPTGELRRMRSEAEVFEFVGLKYVEPWER